MAQRKNFLSTKLVLSNLAAPKEYHIPPRLSRGIRTPEAKILYLVGGLCYLHKKWGFGWQNFSMPKVPLPLLLFYGFMLL